MFDEYDEGKQSEIEVDDRLWTGNVFVSKYSDVSATDYAMLTNLCRTSIERPTSNGHKQVLRG